ncbi:T9SS type A sorting domain-containing protein [Larkinella soli]|uniref:T9SS type A sorting domain-containing protein n=1 Tax=Larkinella soli TaxID=1770527 RepID=UPI000FFBB583|nr:T9SS type A sorting domain-containing protein [Larkinella soli]
MKQSVRLYFWFTGLALLLSQNILAQSDSGKTKSRLELGQKPSATTGRVIHSRNFPFLKHPTVSGIDRPVSVQKNDAINQYYRNQMLNGTASKPAVRSNSVETGAPVAVEARQQSAEDAARMKADDRMFANERITVSNIYPNPANDFAEIDYQIAGSVKDAKLTFYNVLGAPVAEYGLDKNERKIRIATREMNSGMYLYQLSLDGKKVATKKLMVSHQ